MRDRAYAIWATAGSLGGMIGFLLGGVLTSAFGWRSIFLINGPIGAVAIMDVLATLLQAGKLGERGVHVGVVRKVGLVRWKVLWQPASASLAVGGVNGVVHFGLVDVEVREAERLLVGSELEFASGHEHHVAGSVRQRRGEFLRRWRGGRCHVIGLAALHEHQAADGEGERESGYAEDRDELDLRWLG